jgi:DNA-binding NarL/FixJ family response regulator
VAAAVTGGAGPVRVVVVDDHGLFRAGVMEILACEGVEVVAGGATGPDAVRLAREYQPDVLLLDVEMPGPGARQTLVELRRAAPATRVAVLTMHDDPGLVRELLEVGAVAYLMKTMGPEQLIAAVRSVAQGGGEVLVSVPRATMERLGSAGQQDLLSPREVEVLRLIAAARSNAQVARQLVITEGTVKRHLSNIYGKLGAVSRVDAIRKAKAARILTEPDD